MPLDYNVIPASDRTPGALAVHIEMYKTSLDTVAVKNPDAEDYPVYNDRMGANERWVIPGRDKDVGFGKGVQHVPRFIAKRYLNHKGIEMINQIIQEDWDARKGKYSEDERSRKEEGLALRSSDPKLWDKVTPQLWVGIVARYGVDDFAEDLPEQATPENRGSSPGDSALERLGMADREVDIDQAKRDLIEGIK